MRLHRTLGDRQAESRSRLAGRASFERLEDGSKLCLRNPGTRVTHVNDELVWEIVDRHFHVAAIDVSQEATRQKEEIDTSGRDPSPPDRDPSPPDGADNTYEQAIGAYERANRLHTWGAAVLIAGAVVSGATLMYVVLPRNAEIRAHAGGAEVRFVW